MTTQEAVKKLTTELKADPGYWISWKANIAIQFQDEWDRAVADGGLPCTRDHIHEISNKAADAFLNLLCREVLA